MKNKSVWLRYTASDRESCERACKEYMAFLSDCKTERECVEEIRRSAEREGFRELAAYRKAGKLQVGDQVYVSLMDKTILLFRLGKRPLEEGMNILGAHLDSPRLDAKQNPLYEKEDFAYFDTHYYGGIKKYQWVSLPLALHGVIVKKDGSRVQVRLGEKAEDPVFFVSDLLIHLATEQMKKKGEEVVTGEALDVVVGNRAAEEKEEDGQRAVKANILAVLQERYGIEEEDFLSAEIEIVPAGAAREAGFDRSMILAYGHDDRVCAWSSVQAMFAAEDPERTTCCILTDKEEIGSVGATGMESYFFENAVAELVALTGDKDPLTLRRCLAASRMLSADVNSAYDPLYEDAFDARNASYLGRGLALSKFSGSAGKSGGNDANPEFIARLRRIFDEAGVGVQMAELGKVDLGGGGTIAYIPARYGMDVVDCGIAVLNMHAPWEAVSKADVYEMLRGFKAFLQSN